MILRTLVALAAAWAPATAQSPSPAQLPAAPPFFFLQMTDPQFGMYAENRGFEQETANFEFAMAAANRLWPAFVIVTGDLVNKPGDAAQIAEYKRIAGKLNPAIRLYNVAGNHDVGNEPTPASLAAWRESFGPDYYSFRSGEMAGLVLDSCLEKTPQHLAAEAAKQEEWLKRELAKARRDGMRHVVVFQHHPFFLKEPDEPEEYFNIPVETRRRFLALFREYAVKFVFTGHYHRLAGGRDGDLEMVTTGPVGKPLATGKSGFRLVTIGPEGLKHRYVDFSNLPDQVR